MSEARIVAAGPRNVLARDTVSLGLLTHNRAHDGETVLNIRCLLVTSSISKHRLRFNELKQMFNILILIIRFGQPYVIRVFFFFFYLMNFVNLFLFYAIKSNIDIF